MRHEVREPLALPRPVALLLFPTCADVPRLREEIADGTCIVRTAAGEALATLIPRQG